MHGFTRRRLFAPVLIAIMAWLAACGGQPAAPAPTAAPNAEPAQVAPTTPAEPTTAVEPTTAPTTDAPERLAVVATYSILGDLVNNVAGDAIDLTVLVGPGGDAHTYQPTPLDSAALAQADLLFENGLEFDSWIEDLYTASGSQATRVLASAKVTPLPTAEEHGHSEEEGHSEEHGHSDALAHACGHFDDNPMAVTAATDQNAASVAIPNDHTRYDIALAGGQGFVTFSRDADAEVSFYLGVDTPFALLQNGAPLMAEAVTPITEGCDAVKMIYTYDLAPGDYLVQFGPGAVDSVTLVWETGGEHSHSDEEKDAAHEDEHGHSHGEFDPHIWHDPNNAKLMVEVIRDALVSADPANASVYQANAAAYVGELTELDAFITAEVAKLPAERRKLVTSHDTFGYFAERYGFEIVGTALGSVSTEAADPSAGALADLVMEIRAAGVPAIFAENVANPTLMETIAREAGVQLAPTLYTDALGEPGSAGMTYIEMMRANVTTIVTALAG